MVRVQTTDEVVCPIRWQVGGYGQQRAIVGIGKCHDLFVGNRARTTIPHMNHIYPMCLDQVFGHARRQIGVEEEGAHSEGDASMISSRSTRAAE